MTFATSLNSVTVGRVLSEAIGVVRRNFPAFFIISLICVALPDLLFGLAAMNAAPSAASGSSVVSWIGQSVLLAAVTHGVLVDRNGGRVTWREAMGTAARLLLPMLGLVFITAAGVILGLMVFIIPGVILACMWAVATPARVAEGPGLRRAMGRSIALTSGRRWTVLGLYLLFFLLALVVNAVALGVLGFLGPWVSAAVSSVVAALLAIVGAAGAATLYCELRQAKEGIGSEALAAVFD